MPTALRVAFSKRYLFRVYQFGVCYKCEQQYDDYVVYWRHSEDQLFSAGGKVMRSRIGASEDTAYLIRVIQLVADYFSA
jgi:hypothetical protein